MHRWLPTSVENNPKVQRMAMSFRMEQGLRFGDPMLINPVTQEAYSVNYEMEWMVPYPEERRKAFQAAAHHYQPLAPDRLADHYHLLMPFLANAYSAGQNMVYGQRGLPS